MNECAFVIVCVCDCVRAVLHVEYSGVSFFVLYAGDVPAHSLIQAAAVEGMKIFNGHH